MKTETTSLLYFVQVKKLLHRSDSIDFPNSKDHPIAVDYTIEGYCPLIPKDESFLGKELIIARTKRNELERLGVFMTTPILGILHDVGNKVTTIKTANSVYAINYSIGPNGGVAISLDEIENSHTRFLVKSVFFPSTI